jgi:hypothetical protein
MRTTTIVLIVAATGAVMAAPAAAKSSRYRVVKATGAEAISFKATASGCETRGNCGVRGRFEYEFGGAPKGSIDLSPTTGGKSSFRTTATTDANVIVPGATKPCTDTKHPRSDGFDLTRLGSKRLLFTAHQVGGAPLDYLKTSCMGPSAGDLMDDHALPKGAYAQSSFTGGRISFRTSGSTFFSSNGWEGTIKWRLSYRLEKANH